MAYLRPLARQYGRTDDRRIQDGSAYHHPGPGEIPAPDHVGPRGIRPDRFRLRGKHCRFRGDRGADCAAGRGDHGRRGRVLAGVRAKVRGRIGVHGNHHTRGRDRRNVAGGVCIRGRFGAGRPGIDRRPPGLRILQRRRMEPRVPCQRFFRHRRLCSAVDRRR